MSQELPANAVPLVSDEYPEKVHVKEQQHGKKGFGSHIKRCCCSSITFLSSTPPPGLKCIRMSMDVWKCMKWLVAWIIYLMLGALIFMKLAEEYYQEPVPKPDWIKFKERLTGQEKVEEFIDLKDNLVKICNHSFLNQKFPFELSDEDVEENRRNGIDYQWSLGEVERACRSSLFTVEWVTHYENVPSLIDAIHYTMTALTTVGYGHICPVNPGNRMFCVFYCSIGIPLTFILLNSFAELLAIKLLYTYKTSLAHRPDRKDYLLYLVTAFLITMGFIVFMFIPAIAFVFLENLTYLNSFYYTFVTLSTIGFGDIYAGFEDYHFNIVTDEETNKLITDVLITVYKLIIIIWVMTALGYWLLIIKFVMKAMKNTTQNFSKNFSSQVITEQATSFRDLVWKMRNINEDGTLTNVMHVTPTQPNGMDLMKDVEGSLSDKGSKNGFTPFPSNHSDVEAPDQPLSLKQLLGMNVVIRNDDATLMKNIVAQVAKGENGVSDIDNIPDEVTLPLRDALNLVFSYQQ